MKIALELESFNSHFSDQDIATPDEADLQDHPFLLKPACIHCFTTPSLRELPWGNQDIATADDEAKFTRGYQNKVSNLKRCLYGAGIYHDEQSCKTIQNPCAMSFSLNQLQISVCFLQFWGMQTQTAKGSATLSTHGAHWGGHTEHR